MSQRAFLACVGVYVLAVVLGMCIAMALVPLWFGR
jgi:hypothetical protein